MKTADAFKIGLALGKIGRTLDAWEENKHKRAKNGQFSSTGGGGESSKSSNEGEHWFDKKERQKEESVNKFKEQIKQGKISSHEKQLLAEGRENVKSGEWTEKQYENLIRGIATSKMERKEFEEKQPAKESSKVESGKKEMEDFVSKYGTGISVKELASKVSRHLASKGYDVTILNDKYPVIEGKNFQLIKNKSKGTWGIKEW